MSTAAKSRFYVHYKTVHFFLHSFSNTWTMTALDKFNHVGFQDVHSRYGQESSFMQRTNATLL